MRLPWEELEPASRSTTERQRRAVLRLERLTDCVFSATVMVIVILPAIPHLLNAADSPLSWQSLLQMYPTLLLHVLSVFILFVLWILHHYEFHYLTRASGALAWLNALLLLCVAVTPVTTSLLNGFASDGAAVLLYEVDVLAMLLLLVFIWRHAAGAGLLFGSDIPSRTVERMRLVLRAGAVLLLLIAVLAPFVPNLSLALTAALFILYAVITARGGYALDLRRGRPASRDN